MDRSYYRKADGLDLCGANGHSLFIDPGLVGDT